MCRRISVQGGDDTRDADQDDGRIPDPLVFMDEREERGEVPFPRSITALSGKLLGWIRVFGLMLTRSVNAPHRGEHILRD